MKLVKSEGTEATPEFRLLGDRVAIIADPVEEVTASGLFVPESGQELLRYGTVSVVGCGHTSDQTGARVPLDVQAGDRIFFNRHSGSSITIQEQEYLFLGHNEIVGVMGKDQGHENS